MNYTTVEVTGRSWPYTFDWTISAITSNEILIQLDFQNP